MRHSYLTFFTILITPFVYSQSDVVTNEIVELKKQKKRVELTIKNLTDSLSKIDIKIGQLNSVKILEKVKDSSLTTIVRKGTKLKKEASLLSDIITAFTEDKEVIILDYKDDHFQVCQNKLCGYISEVWIPSNDLIIEFKKSKETERKNIEQTNKLYSHKTTLTNYNHNNTSYEKKNYQSTRTYYKGSKGGCYYINSNGNKTYVSRSLCN